MPIDAFLCPGHVSVIIGTRAYAGIAADYGRPCVVAGFEPAQMLEGIQRILKQLRAGQAEVDNVYGVAVTDVGNPVAGQYVEDVFEVGPAEWRAIGTIPGSGLELRESYRQFDACTQLNLTLGENCEPAGCRCGEVIQGKATPAECRLFGKDCTTTNPVGPCMVSSEGTCAAHFRYGRRN